MCDHPTTYCQKVELYAGKTGDKSEKKQAKRVVLQLTEGLKGNITVDRWFTSYELSHKLLARGMTSVGTINDQRREVPKEFRWEKSRIEHETLFGFREEAMICSYIPKRGKAVTMLSTLHRRPEITDDPKKNKKPMDYNARKCMKYYTVRRKTRRWPLASFHFLLNATAYNAYRMWLMVDPGFCGGKKPSSGP